MRRGSSWAAAACSRGLGRGLGAPSAAGARRRAAARAPGAAAICTGAAAVFSGPPAARLGGSGRYSIIPVERSANRLFWVSSRGSEIIGHTSRALSVPSTRDSTYPSAGVRVTRWKRSSGSEARPSTRSMSPR